MAAKLIVQDADGQDEIEMPLIDIINNISGINYIYINDIPFNGKKYEIKYDDNLVSFTCEDGREISCYFNPDCFYVRFNFYHSNGDCFLFKTDNISYDSNGNTVIYASIVNTEFKFSSMNPSFSTTIKDVYMDCYDVEGDKIVFGDNSISYLGYDISLDGTKLLKGDSFSNIDFLEIEKYNHEKERELLLSEISNNPKLNALTKASLLNMVQDSLLNVRNLNDDNNYTSSISNLLYFSKYEMPIVRKVIYFRKALENDDFFNKTISSDELYYLTSVLEDNIKHIENDLGIQKKKERV